MSADPFSRKSWNSGDSIPTRYTIDRPIDSQTCKQTHRQTYKQAHGQTNI
jgi:hypothetical protein